MVEKTSERESNNHKHDGRKKEGDIPRKKGKGHQANNHTGANSCDDFKKQSHSPGHGNQLKAHNSKECDCGDDCGGKSTVGDAFPVKTGDDRKHNGAP